MVFTSGGNDAYFAECIFQDWIEGNSIVNHVLTSVWRKMKMTTDCCSEEAAIDTKGGLRNYGIEMRNVVSFYEDKFVFKLREVNKGKCKRCERDFCFYDYKMLAWFAMI